MTIKIIAVCAGCHQKSALLQVKLHNTNSWVCVLKIRFSASHKNYISINDIAIKSSENNQTNLD